MPPPLSTMPTLARNVLKVTFERGLPIEDVDIEDDEMGGLRVRFAIRGVPFMTWLSRQKLQRLNAQGISYAKEALGPFYELRRMCDEAEERGRENERKSILGKLATRTEALGLLEYAFKTLKRLRRLRRAARRARRTS